MSDKMNDKFISLVDLAELKDYLKDIVNERTSIIVNSELGDELDRMIDENIKKDKEIERLNNIINECANDILKELKENNHLSYGVALAIRQKLLDYKELKGDDKE